MNRAASSTSADVRVAEAVNRLLPIADDEDRWRDRVGGGAEAFAPAPDELTNELPLRAAGVLKLVDEDVAIARLQPQAAFSELVEVLQQLHGPFEDA